MAKTTQSAEILILGTMDDPHVERVTFLLSKQGITHTVLDYKRNNKLEFHMDQNGTFDLKVGDYFVGKETIIWDRSLLMAGTDFYPVAPYEHAGFIAEEWRALYKLINGLMSDNVINSLSSKACLIKPMQQRMAAESGFSVPATLVTQRKDRAQEFSRKHGAIVVKSLSGVRHKPANESEFVPVVVMTSKVDDVLLAESSEEDILSCPHFFQEEINKQNELRVTVVGTDIFAFEINSQEFSSSRTDWRMGMEFLDFSPFTLREMHLNKIIRFMQRSGLTYGCMDLIIDKRDDLWFLECNQNGAWAWLDDIVAGGISGAFSKMLIGRVRNSQSPEVSIV